MEFKWRFLFDQTFFTLNKLLMKVVSLSVYAWRGVDQRSVGVWLACMWFYGLYHRMF